jgi:hypothetical protein
MVEVLVVAKVTLEPLAVEPLYNRAEVFVTRYVLLTRTLAVAVTLVIVAFCGIAGLSKV